MADVLDELARLEDPRTGRRLLERTVIIANTSNMPVMAREASIYTGMTVAEYFRDMGYDAVLHRRLDVPVGGGAAGVLLAHGAASGRGGLPGRRWPRPWRRSTSGPGGCRRSAAAEGSVTVIGAVSPPGGDMTEPVTAHTRAFRPVRCGRSTATWPMPATTRPCQLERSFSRDADAVGGLAGRRRRRRLGGARAVLWRCWPKPTGSHRSPSWSAPPRCRTESGSSCWSATLLREAVLQQSALSPNDATAARPSRPRCSRWCSRCTTVASSLVEARASARAIESVDLSGVSSGRDERWCRTTSPRVDRRCATPCLARLEAAQVITDAGSPHRVHGSVGSVDGRCWSSAASMGSAGTSSATSRLDSGETPPRCRARGRSTTWRSCRCSRAPTGIEPDGASSRLRGTPDAGSRRRRLARTGLQRPGRTDRRRAARASATALVAVNGAPINPAAREAAPRPDPHRRLGHRRPHHPGPGTEAAHLLGRRPAPPRARRADRRPGAGAADEPFEVVFAAMGITHADADAARDALEERPQAGDLALFINTADDPVIERILTPRAGAHRRRAPRLRTRPPRARGHVRHDELLRSRARGGGGPR